MQRSPSHRSRPAHRPEDTKRAVLLSILCSLALLLALALIAWLFWPQQSPLALAGAGGAGSGHGAGPGTSQTDAAGGTGMGSEGTAEGKSSGTGAGGDAPGEAKTPGSETGSAMAKMASPYSGTGEPAGGEALGAPNPASESSAAAAPNTAEKTLAAAPSTPPPVTAPKPSDAPDVMALGDLKFTERSASTGKGPSAGAPSAPAFFGAKGLGTRFVYIVDRSGSMSGDRFTAACDELKKSIRSLKVGMAFHVIFYDSVFEEMPGAQLTPVSSDNVRKAIAWIDQQTPRGGTEPDEAMVRALELKPHTMWLLTDGRFSDQITARIDAANPTRSTSISTIAFHDPSAEALLRKIAKENRGDYTFVPPPGGKPATGLPASGLSSPADRKPEWEKTFGKGAKP